MAGEAKTLRARCGWNFQTGRPSSGTIQTPFLYRVPVHHPAKEAQRERRRRKNDQVEKRGGELLNFEYDEEKKNQSKAKETEPTEETRKQLGQQR